LTLDVHTLQNQHFFQKKSKAFSTIQISIKQEKST